MFQQIQKTLFLSQFWSIFPIFGAKNFFSENPAVSRTTLYDFLAPCQNLEETIDSIETISQEGQKDVGKDG